MAPPKKNLPVHQVSIDDGYSQEAKRLYLRGVRESMMTDIEAARFANITSAQLAEWQERAQRADQSLPFGWETKPLADLRVIAHEAGIDLNEWQGTGPKGAFTRNDMLYIIHEELVRYLALFEEVKRERTKAMNDLTQIALQVAAGGTIETAEDGRVRWRPLTTTKKTYKVVDGERILSSEVVSEIGPNPKMILELLGRRFDSWIPSKAVDSTNAQDPAELSKVLQQAIKVADQSVPMIEGPVKDEGDG